MPERILTDKGWRYKQQKIHLLRAKWHDYLSPSIYMLTLTSLDREPVFGKLTGDIQTPTITLSPIGQMVSEQIEQIPTYKGFDQTEIYSYIVMPDHVHILLYVRQKLQHPLGYYVSWFKKQCSDHARGISLASTTSFFSGPALGANSPSSQGSALAVNSASPQGLGPALGANSPSKSPLIFDPEYHDRILTHQGQLDHLKQYILDNPRRLAIKRANPEFFRLRQDIEAANLTFTALGNLFWLNYPLKQMLQCSRSLSQNDIDNLRDKCLTLADQGIVFISAGISEGEKQICRALRENGFPLIILLKDGFPNPDDPNAKYFKPKGVYFEACAEGQLLLLEPHHDVFFLPNVAQPILQRYPQLPQTSTRYRFLALNEMARLLQASSSFRSCSRG